MAQYRKLSGSKREQVLSIYETLGRSTTAKITGVRPGRLDKWVGDKGKITDAEARRILKAYQQREPLKKAQEQSREKREWYSFKTKKYRTRSEQQINQGLKDLLNKSLSSKRQRDLTEKQRTTVAKIFDRLGLPFTGKDAIYLNRPGARLKRAA